MSGKMVKMIAPIAMALVLMLVLLPGCAKEEALNDWNGTWVNVGTVLDDPAMDAVYEAMADAANAAGDGAFTADNARNFLHAMHKASFGDLGIAGDTITYYSVDGTVGCECEYESAGIETVALGEEEFDWYKFELTSEDAACYEYRYLILCKKHSHEGGMLHFHMRYGDTSFDDLINNPAYAMWYPTLAVEGTTVEDVADGYVEGAEMMGYMMLAS
jgi:Zn/Cd-binding protein ZinT